jgi:hypothetical protein
MVPANFSILPESVFPVFAFSEAGEDREDGDVVDVAAGFSGAGCCCDTVTEADAAHATTVKMRTPFFIFGYPPCKDIYRHEMFFLS